MLRERGILRRLRSIVRNFYERRRAWLRQGRPEKFIACSECFRDEGLKLDAEIDGHDVPSDCPHCGTSNGKKLTQPGLDRLAHRFFVWGTLSRGGYGAAPRVQFNPAQTTEIEVSDWLRNDIEVFENLLGVGFFYYAPRLWMVGEVEPLKELQSPVSRDSVLDRILTDYPSMSLLPGAKFYRIRKFPTAPDDPAEYDSPPLGVPGNGRFDSPDLPVMYCSPDIQVCLHECRIAADDEIFMATILSTKSLRILNLSWLLEEEGVTEFESLDIALNMLFLAGRESYGISQSIARAAFDAGFDGLVYPSFFSLLRTGAMPFETGYGLSLRIVPSMRGWEEAKQIPNLALFGRPVEDGRVEVQCINRVMLTSVDYGALFGPASV